ncbi:MAG: hypothetical protein ACPGXX_21935, partial [Planctomycetaceae bacterium]
GVYFVTRTPPAESPRITAVERPAAEVESIRSQYLNSTPLPRIPLPTGFRSGGSGAASQASGSGSMGMGMSMSGMVGENMLNSPGIAVPASSQH